MVSSSDKFVTITRMHHITRIVIQDYRNTTATIKKINADEYVNLTTGEIHDINHSSTRADNIASLRHSMQKLRLLINNNFVGAKNELFLTLTYAQNMQDHHQLGKDWKNFFHRLQTKYPAHSFDYIRVNEPQQRGAWHVHVLLKTNLDKLTIPNSELSSLWTHGFVKVQRLRKVDNIGQYLSAYLTDIPLDEYHDTRKTLFIKPGSKRLVKAGRLYLYLPGTNLYSKSKGITFPQKDTMSLKKFQSSHFDFGPKTYEKSFSIVNAGFDMSVAIMEFNKKRQKNKGDFNYGFNKW